MTPKHPRDAFNSAFLKGMAASVLMFSPGKPPRFRIKTPKPRRMSDLEAMREDWYKIGADLNRVIRRETGQ
jgi:hypothetical protein